MNVVRSDKEIRNLEDLAWESEYRGHSSYPAMSYEEGIRNTLAWLRGDDDTPLLP